MSKLVILIFPLIAFLFSDENINTDSLTVITTDNDSSYVKEHISLLLNERMINDFLQRSLSLLRKLFLSALLYCTHKFSICNLNFCQNYNQNDCQFNKGLKYKNFF